MTHAPRGDWQSARNVHRSASEEVSSPMRHRFSALSTVFAQRCLSEHERFIQLMDAAIAAGTEHTTTRTSGKLRGLVKLCEERISIIEEFIQDHVRMYGDFDKERVHLFLRTIEKLKQARMRALGLNSDSEYHPDHLQANVVPHLNAHKASELQQRYTAGGDDVDGDLNTSPAALEPASPGPRTIKPHPDSRGNLTAGSGTPGGGKVRGHLGIARSSSVSASPFDSKAPEQRRQEARSGSLGIPKSPSTGRRSASTKASPRMDSAPNMTGNGVSEEPSEMELESDAKLLELHQHALERFRLALQMVQMEEEQRRKTVKDDCISILRSWYSMHKDMRAMIQGKETRQNLTNHALALSQERLTGQMAPLNQSASRSSSPAKLADSSKLTSSATTGGGSGDVGVGSSVRLRRRDGPSEVKLVESGRLTGTPGRQEKSKPEATPKDRDDNAPTKIWGDLDLLHILLFILGCIIGTLFGAILLPIIIREYSTKTLW